MSLVFYLVILLKGFSFSEIHILNEENEGPDWTTL